MTSSLSTAGHFPHADELERLANSHTSSCPSFHSVRIVLFECFCLFFSLPDNLIDPLAFINSRLISKTYVLRSLLQQILSLTSVPTLQFAWHAGLSTLGGLTGWIKHVKEFDFSLVNKKLCSGRRVVKKLMLEMFATLVYFMCSGSAGPNIYIGNIGSHKFLLL